MILMAAAILSATTIARAGEAETMAERTEWSEDQRAVWETITRWNEAFARNDAEAYFSFVDENITVLTPAGPYRVEGKADDREEFEFGVKQGRTRVSLFQEIQPLVAVSGDLAFATYYSRGWYGGVDGAMAHLKETDVLVRKNGAWRILHVHVSK